MLTRRKELRIYPVFGLSFFSFFDSQVRSFLLKGPAHPMNDLSKTSTRVVGHGRLDWRFRVRMRSWNDGEMEDVDVGGIAYESG